MNISTANSDPRQISALQRLGFQTAAILIVYAIGSAITNFVLNDSLQAWQLSIDGYVSIALAITLAISLLLFRRFNIKEGALVIIFSLLISFVVRVYLIKGLAISSGVLTLIIPTSLALLYFPSTRLSPLSAASFLIGSGAVLADFYLKSLRHSASTEHIVILAILSVLVFLGIAAAVVRASRFLPLIAKLAVLVATLALLPALILGLVNSITLRLILLEQGNQSLTTTAQKIASDLEFFVQSNRQSVQEESKSVTIIQYTIANRNGTADDELRSQTLGMLRSFSLRNSAYIVSYAILNANGTNILDTVSYNIGGNEGKLSYFTQPILTGNSYLSDLIVVNGRPSLYFSAPIYNEQHFNIGVIRVQFDAMAVQKIVDRYNFYLGADCFATLFNENYVFIADGEDKNAIGKTIRNDDVKIAELQKENLVLPGNLNDVLINNPDFYIGLLNMNKTPVFKMPKNPGAPGSSTYTSAAVKIPDLNWIIVFHKPETEFLIPLDRQLGTSTIVIIIIGAISAFISLIFIGWLIQPISSLTLIASQIAGGELDARAQIDSVDEIGHLGSTFNFMADQLREMLSTLEARVNERTSDLERRALQLQAAAEVGNAVANLRDLSSLLGQIVHLISDRFGFYHVGIFLLDEQGENAVLRAANSQGGQRMLAREHKLKVGQVGIVGNVTSTGKARIALDVGRDAVFFDNPDLPETRSEMAMPLTISGKILGALDVQSREEAAFSQEDIATLQVLADQIAIAIENARLFTENRLALESTRLAYGEITGQSWKSLLTARTNTGYIAIERGDIVPLQEKIAQGNGDETEMMMASTEDNGMTLKVPVMLRGRPIGILRLKKGEKSTGWTTDEIASIEAIADQLSLSLESARLYNEAQLRARLERTISEITSNIGASIELDTILRTTVQEVGKALGDSEVVIQIGQSDNNPVNLQN